VNTHALASIHHRNLWLERHPKDEPFRDLKTSRHNFKLSTYSFQTDQSQPVISITAILIGRVTNWINRVVGKKAYREK